MLKIMNQEHFTRVVEFACKTGQAEMLFARLLYLHYYADGQRDYDTQSEVKPPNGRTVVELGYDGAAASFGVCWFQRVVSYDRDPWTPEAERKEDEPELRFWFNGGMIYRGDQTGWSEDNRYIDPFSVDFGHSPGDNPWTINT